MSEKINVYLKGIFTPIGDVEIRVYDSEREKAFFKGNTIRLTQNSNVISAIKMVDLTPEEIEYITLDVENKKINEPLLKILTDQYNEVREFLGYMQAFDAIYNLDPELHMKHNYLFSIDNREYRKLHFKWPTSWRGANFTKVIGDNVMANLSGIAAKGIPVFTAFRFLFQAYSEKNTRFKWINATIAAELAFKEFVSLYDEKLELLMLHLPSPPLHKLYGQILEGYTGNKSSMSTKLAKGAEKRNDLVHKHKSEPPSLKDTNVYIHQVEVAIFELYKALYSKEAFFEYLLTNAKHRLEHVENGGAHYQ